MRIPLTMKTHETQEAARFETGSYLEELRHLSRLTIALRRADREHVRAKVRTPAPSLKPALPSVGEHGNDTNIPDPIREPILDAVNLERDRFA